MRLDRRITFLRASNVDDGLAVVPTFTALAPVYFANVKEAAVNEQQGPGEVQSIIQTQFTCRSDALTITINPKDRILFQSVTYDITGRLEIGRRMFVRFNAVARNDL
jgi:hypothetical protein